MPIYIAAPPAPAHHPEPEPALLGWSADIDGHASILMHILGRMQECFCSAKTSLFMILCFVSSSNHVLIIDHFSKKWYSLRPLPIPTTAHRILYEMPLSYYSTSLPSSTIILPLDSLYQMPSYFWSSWIIVLAFEARSTKSTRGAGGI